MSKSKRRRASSKPQGRKPSGGPVGTKTDKVLKLLSRPNGATMDEIAKATGWQSHSVRGFLAGYVRKKRGLALSSEKGLNAPRRYMIK